MTIEKPKEPLSVGAVVIWTIICPLFGLIALAIRNRDLDYGEPRVTKPVEPPRPMGIVFRLVMVIVAVVVFAILLASQKAHAEFKIPADPKDITVVERHFSDCRVLSAEKHIEADRVTVYLYDCMLIRGFTTAPDPAVQQMMDEAAQRRKQAAINKNDVDEFLKTLKPKPVRAPWLKP